MNDDELSNYDEDNTLFIGSSFSSRTDVGSRWERHKPFRADLTMSPDLISSILDRLGCLDLASTPLKLSALGSILANLASHPHGAQVFYSRDRNHYSKRSRYLPPHVTYTYTLDAVSGLAGRGIIEHTIARPSSRGGMSSSFASSNTLFQTLSDLKAALKLRAKRQDTIILRDAKKVPIGYADNYFTCSARRDLEEINEDLGRIKLTISHPEVENIDENHILLRGALLNIGHLHLYRVFTEDFDQNGRFYGGVWQWLPKSIRQHGLLINGEPVVELDYRACHLRILCELVQFRLPFRDPNFDPFDVPGFDRKLVKVAFNILLNARNRAGSKLALAKHLKEIGDARGIRWDVHLPSALLHAVRTQFWYVKPFWNTRFGLRLLNLDAALCSENMRALRKLGIPCLSVHDSFIVPARHEVQLKSIMDDSFDLVMNRVASKSYRFGNTAIEF